MAWPLVAGAAVSVIGGIIGGNKKANAEAAKAKAHNKAVERKYKYDKEAWKMSKDRLKADYEFAHDRVQIQRLNENKTAAWKDAVNMQRYQYDLKIRNREQESLNNQYARSEQLYGIQREMNSMAADAGKEDEYRKLREAHTSAQFQAQDNYVDRLVQQGQTRALGISGRSADKAQQSDVARYTRQMAAINESLASEGRNTRAMLKEIGRDKISADLAAYANKMLDPGEIPMPLMPFKTPIATFQDPRKLKKYDFGPKPIRGAKQSVSAARSSAWGDAISGIAGSVGSSLMGAAGTVGSGTGSGYTPSGGWGSFGNFGSTA